MDIFLTVLLILAALILLYVLWCLAEPFFLVNDRVVLKKHETDKGTISKETISKLPFVPQGSSDAPDLRLFFFSDIHTEWCPVTAARMNKAIRKAHATGGLDAVLFGGDIITYPENSEKGYKYLNEVSACCRELGIPFYGISGNIFVFNLKFCGLLRMFGNPYRCFQNSSGESSGNFRMLFSQQF